MNNEVKLSKDRLLLFQLYLLSTMRVQPTILEDALMQLQAVEKDLFLAKENMLAVGFGTIGVPSSLYREILGPPVSIEQVDNNKIPATFHGSLSLVFKLPLWKDFDFVVNEHPEGQAWDIGFRRSKSEASVPPLRSAAELKPWRFVKAEVTNSFGTPESGDAWDCWEELYYLIPTTEQEQPQNYFLLFDYNLLQSFEATSQI